MCAYKHELSQRKQLYDHMLAVNAYIDNNESIWSYLFHRLTRTAYFYNRCLPWYNVVLTSRVHSSVKYSQQSQLRTRATVE